MRQAVGTEHFVFDAVRIPCRWEIGVDFQRHDNMTFDAVSISQEVAKKSSIEKMAARSTSFERLPDEIIEQ